MKLFVVKDGSKTGEYLQQGLSEAGFVVDLTRNGLDGRYLAMTGDYGLLILDVMLPDLEGWQILHALRSTGLAVPVLSPTVRDSVADRVKGLELSVDDYMVKPFAFAELLARVQTLLQRSSAPSLAERIRVADLVLDLARCRASRGGQRVTLTSKGFSLLKLLARHHGEALPRSLITSRVWDMNFDSNTNVIDVAIRRLRAKIDDDFKPKLIYTAHDMGYVLGDSEDGE